MIREKTARKICSEWHNGQWSAFYSFSSSGMFLADKHDYIGECKECLKHAVTKKDKTELEKLLIFFQSKSLEVSE